MLYISKGWSIRVLYTQHVSYHSPGSAAKGILRLALAGPWLLSCSLSIFPSSQCKSHGK